MVNKQNKLLIRRLFVFVLTFTISSMLTAINVHAQTWQDKTEHQKQETFLTPVRESAMKLIKQQLDNENSDEEECRISNSFPEQIQRWKIDICRWSEDHKMDPDLIATVMLIESCGNPDAISATGVRGLFQVTGANLEGGDPFDPNVSMAMGPGKVLKLEIDAAGGDVRAAMAGYNGGGKARDYISGKISRDQFYWFLVNHPSGYWRTRSKALAKINEVERYAQWTDIYFEAKEGKTDTYQVWSDLGGYRLCEASSKVAMN